MRTQPLARIASVGTLLLAAAVGHASVDQPAALLIYPSISVDSGRGVDTVVQLSNTENQPVSVSCYYQSADASCGLTAFTIKLTPQQPLQWRASIGLGSLPLGEFPGPTGAFNSGFIPPVRSDPFDGSLTCFVIATDPPRPLASEMLAGSATLEQYQSALHFDVASYGAIGFGATSINATAPEDVLVLGGAEGAYAACPVSLFATHYFDSAFDAPTAASVVTTRLVIIPCTRALTGQSGRDHVIQYLTTNEFEQQLAITTTQSGCAQEGAISTIDTGMPERSIFNVAVQGTLTGQTRIRADQGASGIVGIGIETHTPRNDAGGVRRTMFTLATQGAQRESDYITLPGSGGNVACAGDCNKDNQVDIDELIRCVNIALDPDLTGSCVSCDVNRSGDVSVDEIVLATGKALDVCDPTDVSAR